MEQSRLNQQILSQLFKKSVVGYKKTIVPQARHFRRLFLFAVAGALLSGCELFSSDKDGLEMVQINRIAWTQVRTPNYSYTHTRSCFCVIAGTFRVVVRNGSVFSAADTLDSVPVPEEFLDVIPTVDGIFDILEAAYRDDADEIHVEYGKYGVPAVIDIDYIKEAVDDELSLRASDVTLAEK